MALSLAAAASAPFGPWTTPVCKIPTVGGLGRHALASRSSGFTPHLDLRFFLSGSLARLKIVMGSVNSSYKQIRSYLMFLEKKLGT